MPAEGREHGQRASGTPLTEEVSVEVEQIEGHEQRLFRDAFAAATAEGLLELVEVRAPGFVEDHCLAVEDAAAAAAMVGKRCVQSCLPRVIKRTRS